MFTRLYLHIPFCIQKCSYCSFFSIPLSDDSIERYCGQLCTELKLASNEAGSVRLESIYFGGGTPSLLNPTQLSMVMDTIHKCFEVRESAEITLEANPGTVSLQGFKEFRSCGVNRISLGIQSFDDRMLQLLGRIHTATEAREAVAAARAARFDNLGIDLIYGLPGQTLHDWRYELEQAVELSTEHLSVYGLTLEEGTPFFNRYGHDLHGIPDDELSAQMFELTHEHLTQLGFEHYEIANYARSGYRSQHNSGYWKRDGYLGVGAGAHSFMLDGDGVRFSNVDALQGYGAAIDSCELPRHDYTSLSLEDAMAEFMFLGLRLSDGVSYRQFYDKFGIQLQEKYATEIARCASLGLLEQTSAGVSLSPRGMLLSNQVFSCFV